MNQVDYVSAFQLEDCVRLFTLLHVVACCWELLRKAGLKRVKHLATHKRTQQARSIQPEFPEISVQNSMDRFGPTGKVSKKLVHLLRWTTFRGRKFWLNGSRPTVPNKLGVAGRLNVESVCTGLKTVTRVCYSCSS